MGKLLYTIFEILPLVQKVVPALPPVVKKPSSQRGTEDYPRWMSEEAKLHIQEPGMTKNS
jgi:hypothetical protein